MYLCYRWKESERNKMKIGGNQNAREFLEAQPDWKKNVSLAQKYKTLAAANLKRKIQIESEGGTWDPIADSLQEPTNFGGSKRLSGSMPDPVTPDAGATGSGKSCVIQ